MTGGLVSCSGWLGQSWPRADGFDQSAPRFGSQSASSHSRTSRHTNPSPVFPRSPQPLPPPPSLLLASPRPSPGASPPPAIPRRPCELGGGMNGQGRWAMRATPSTRSAPPLPKSSPRALHPTPSSLVSSDGQVPILLRFPSLSSFSSLTTRLMSPSRVLAAATASPGGSPSVLQSSRPGPGGGRGDPGVQAVARSMQGDVEPMSVGVSVQRNR